MSERKKAKIEIKISADTNSRSFTKFTIKNVYFILDGDKTAIKKDTVLFDGLYFIYNESKFSKKLIHSKIRIKQGDFYNFSDAEETQRQLGSIDVFNFVNINFQEIQDNQLNVFIYASSSKKHQFSAEGGVNVNVYANSGKGQGLPGPFMNATYKNRKVFKGFEIFQASLIYALAGQINLTEQFRSNEYFINTALLIPKILGPSPEWNLFKNQNQSTRINIGYSNTDRVEYKRASFNTYLGYQFIKNKERFNFSPFGLNLINAEITDDKFRTELIKLDPSVLENFNSSLISSSNISYTFDDNDITKNRKSRFVRFNLESGGTLLNFIKTPSKLAVNDTAITYLKIQWDYRFKTPISLEGAFAYRINLGIAKPIGDLASLPYTKNFFIGCVLFFFFFGNARPACLIQLQYCMYCAVLLSLLL